MLNHEGYVIFCGLLRKHELYLEYICSVDQKFFGINIPFLMFSTKSEVILAMQQEQLKAWEDSHKMNTFEVLFEYLVCSAL